jgi:signal transduction histidine kinase
METELQILLVEDDHQDAEYIRDILNFPNDNIYRIQVRHCLDDALELATQSQFDIVLTDLNLPDSVGLNSLLRLFEAFPGIPIVVLTGLADIETAKNAVQSGAQDYLVKGEIKGESLKRAISYAIERKKVIDRLEETVAMKEVLLDVISHDLKNNAGSIFGLSKILQEQDPENEYFHCIKEASERVLKVIDNASILARISSGEEIDMVAMDLCQIVAEVIDEYSETVKANKMVLEFTATCTEIIRVNPIISEVFKNYISNAIRYAADGKWINVEVEPGYNTILVRVNDLGTPIPKEKREFIFQRRTQLNGNGEKGSGLGLAIVKQIAKMHKGRVWVEPYEGHGNSFCIELAKN